MLHPYPRAARPGVALATLLFAACGGDTPGDAPRGEAGAAATADERLEAWAEMPAGTVVPVGLGFGGAVPDSAVAKLLERSGLRPYIVWLKVGDRVGSLSREQSRASLEILAEAREQAMSQLRTTVCAEQGRARAMLEEPQEGDVVGRYREALSQFLRARRLLPRVRMGASIVYGIEAVGLLPEVRAVRDDPLVAAFEPGWRGRVGRVDTVVVPQPPLPDSGPPPVEPEIAALSDEQVRARMAELAGDENGTCEDGFRPDDPAALEGVAPP